MKGLLLVAHGSRKREARNEILALTQRVAEALRDAYDVVDCAFLQWAEPLVADQLQAFTDQGVTDIVVMPYLLATGAHVATDIPETIETFKRLHPAATVRLLPHIGLADGMTTLICRTGMSGVTP